MPVRLAMAWASTRGAVMVKWIVEGTGNSTKLTLALTRCNKNNETQASTWRVDPREVDGHETVEKSQEGPLELHCADHVHAVATCYLSFTSQVSEFELRTCFGMFPRKLIFDL